MVPRILIIFSFSLAAVAQNGPTAASTTLPPFTASERALWTVRSVVGPKALAAHGVGAGIQTWRNRPEEWGPHWDGWGKRVGARALGTAVRASTEAGLGAFWGEDPRYYRYGSGAFKSRMWNVLKGVVIAHDSDGDPMPAYARYVAIPTAGFAANIWMPDSRSGTKWAFSRMGWSFAGRAGSNAFREFWPDIRKRVFRK